MKIRFKKVDQDGAALACERADGSTTWQRPKSSQAAFFALHDLTHFACESELANLKGFFSLVADGWNISDFETRSKANELPIDAVIVEVIVGLFDTERASQTTWPAAEFNQHLKNYFATCSITLPCELTDDQLQKIRERRNGLFAQWWELPTGEALELCFPDWAGP